MKQLVLFVVNACCGCLSLSVLIVAGNRLWPNGRSASTGADGWGPVTAYHVLFVVGLAIVGIGFWIFAGGNVLGMSGQYQDAWSVYTAGRVVGLIGAVPLAVGALKTVQGRRQLEQPTNQSV